MKFICIKYSGLKFNYPFETKNFIFILDEKMVNVDLREIKIEDFFSCKYDKSAHFYVLAKESMSSLPSLDDLSDELLHNFKFLKAIIGLLFSNRIIKKYIIFLEKKKGKYEILRIFKNLSNEKYEMNPTLIFNNYIITERLKNIINRIHRLNY